MKTLALFAALLAGPVLAQVPGTNAVAPADAGVPDAGVPDAGPIQRSGADDSELLRLKTRVADLQLQLQQAQMRNADQQALADQLQALRDQVAAIEQRQNDRAAARDEAVVQQRQANQDALESLASVQTQLEGGDLADADGSLARAESTLTGRARLEVRAAREALSRGDGFTARQHLAAAMAEAQNPR